MVSELDKARDLLEANIVMGDLDDDTAVFTTAGLIGDIADALSSVAERAEEGTIKAGDRVVVIDYGTVQSINEEDDNAEVLWDVSGCIGDIDLDRLRPAATAAHPAPSGMGVKKLEWSSGNARTNFGGSYTVHMRSDSLWETVGCGSFIGGPFATEAAAKAAAQKDYENRILSALEDCQALIPLAGSDAGEAPHKVEEGHYEYDLPVRKHPQNFKRIPVAQSPTVGDIVPTGCTGSALAFGEGVLYVSKDSSGYIAVDEDHWKLEDDRYAGPDGSEGSVHWIARFTAGGMVALRDFLNGADFRVSTVGEITEEMVERALDAYCKIVPMGVEPRRDGMHAALSAAALTRLPDAGWGSMDSAPKDGTRVLLWSPKWEAPSTGQFYGTDWQIGYEVGPFAYPPTHWMPLPNALPDTGRE